MKTNTIIMRSVVTIVVLLLLVTGIYPQQVPFATRIIEYKPAPGQYINDPVAGTPAVALGILNEPGSALSLGGYGGFIILGFDHRVMNDPGNPYGVDFTIFGNSVPLHAEHGIIQVMKDVNNNGKPDDKWYEIAGSDHFNSKLKKDYAITYYNPGSQVAADVPWKDNKGNTGFVSKNSFHTQPYYPLNSLFPGINSDSVIFTGSVFEGNIKKVQGLFVSHPSAFGYADNTPVSSLSYSVPDNPYTTGVIEGSGGDATDISWAVDENGMYVDLDGIDFIKIYTGINVNSSWLGEISTEIRGVADVPPDPAIQGKMQLILPLNLPEKITASSSLTIRSVFFDRGRVVNGKEIQWISSDPSKAVITNDSVLNAVSAGNVKLYARLKNSTENLGDVTLAISIPLEFQVDNPPSFIVKDQLFSLNYSVLDAAGEKLSGIEPEISVLNPESLQITGRETGKITLKALVQGTSGLQFTFKNYPALNKNKTFVIHEYAHEYEVSVSLTKEGTTIIPRKNYSVKKQEIADYSDRLQGEIKAGDFVSLADVFVSVMLKEGFGTGGNTFLFRNDLKENKLYLWKLGVNYEYTYGWGGSDTTALFSKAWTALLNNKIFINAWDTVAVSPDDIVCFRHVNDLRNEWRHILVFADKQSADPGVEIGFTVKQLIVNPDKDNNFPVSGPYLLPDAKVLVNMNPVLNDNLPLLSSFTGEFAMTFQKNGRFFVGIDNVASEIAEIIVGNPLGNDDTEKKVQNIEVYPNPFTDEIHVKAGSSSFKQYRLYSADGKIIMDNNILSKEKELVIFVKDLKRGVYILQILLDEGVFATKIIRN